MPDDPIGAVKQDLLVRHLDTWIPYALHRSRRATFAQAFAGPDAGVADAALRVFTRFAGQLRGARLSVLVLTTQADGLAARLGEVQAELPPEVTVYPVSGGIDRLPVALRAAGAVGAPLLAYLDVGSGPAPADEILAAPARGRPAEVLLALDGPAGPDAQRAPSRPGLREACGLPLVTEVEVVAGPAPRRSGLLLFATSAGRRLEAFKDALWAVDEGTGVGYRDPAEPDGLLFDVARDPDREPLRQTLLARLAQQGAATVTELRLFTMTRTVYRAADANRVVTDLLAAGQVSREPADGRLTADVTITLTAAGLADRP